MASSSASPSPAAASAATSTASSPRPNAAGAGRTRTLGMQDHEREILAGDDVKGRGHFRKPVYAAQLAALPGLHGRLRRRALPANPALFTAINKDTAELHHELVPFDGALAQRMSDRAVRILRATDAGELLPRLARNPDHYECRMCACAQSLLEPAGMSDDGDNNLPGQERGVELVPNPDPAGLEANATGDVIHFNPLARLQ